MKKRVALITILSLSILIIIIFWGYKSFYSTENVPTSNAEREPVIFDSDKIFLQIDNEDINVYIKGDQEKSDKYIGYHIRHDEKDLDQEAPSSNYNVWRIDGASEYERTKRDSLLEGADVVTKGEWEMAIIERGATDFVGGKAHGDEITKSIELMIDGETHNVEEDFDNEIDEFEMTVISDVYRDNVITEEPVVIGKHKKMYQFSHEGLILEQEVDFKNDMELGNTYMTMLPIIREGVTDTYEVGGKEYDVTTNDFERKEIETNKATIYGKETGIKAELEILEKESDEPTMFYVSNSQDYNKLYFAYFYGNYDLPADENIKLTSKYNIITSN